MLNLDLYVAEKLQEQQQAELNKIISQETRPRNKRWQPSLYLQQLLVMNKPQQNVACCAVCC
jgi:hypothetical protein